MTSDTYVAESTEIQEVLPAFANDPLSDLENDYGSAVIHIAWNRATGSDERTLLFAYVELLPSEVPPPPDDYEDKSGKRLGGKSNHRVYVRHFPTTVAFAVEWYLKCRAGEAVVPWTTASRFVVGAFSEEPLWPGMLHSADTTDALPFCPNYIETPRVHHLLRIQDFERHAIWSSEETSGAEMVLRSELHFDLAAFPEYWGSVHLVAPNPVYRALRSRLQRNPDGSESVLLRFEPRCDRSPIGLELTLEESDGRGVTDLRRIQVESELIRVSFGREVNAVTERVLDPKRGLLKASNATHVFLRDIRTDVHVMRPTVINPGAPDEFRVNRSSKVNSVSAAAGREILPSARGRMLAGQRARKRLAAAARYGQRWFNGEKEEARMALRTLIHEANEKVIFVDPYFGVREMRAFPLAAKFDELPIRILTSAKHLKQQSALSRGPEEGEVLLQTIEQLSLEPHANPVEVKVMPGDPPPLHDRFLQLDGEIWLLGASLGEFGSRGTMIVRLPNPLPIEQELASVWAAADHLSSWVEGRRARRSPGAESP